MCHLGYVLINYEDGTSIRTDIRFNLDSWKFNRYVMTDLKTHFSRP